MTQNDEVIIPYNLSHYDIFANDINKQLSASLDTKTINVLTNLLSLDYAAREEYYTNKKSPQEFIKKCLRRIVVYLANNKANNYSFDLVMTLFTEAIREDEVYTEDVTQQQSITVEEQELCSDVIITEIMAQQNLSKRQIKMMKQTVRALAKTSNIKYALSLALYKPGNLIDLLNQNFTQSKENNMDNVIRNTIINIDHQIKEIQQQESKALEKKSMLSFGLGIATAAISTGVILGTLGAIAPIAAIPAAIISFKLGGHAGNLKKSSITQSLSNSSNVSDNKTLFTPPTQEAKKEIKQELTEELKEKLEPQISHISKLSKSDLKKPEQSYAEKIIQKKQQSTEREI